jgi:hypothetical protein
MAWEQPIINGFQGLNSWFGQIIPILLPILVMIFIGMTVLWVGKRVAEAVS